MKIVLKYNDPIFNSFCEIGRQRALRSGQVRSGRFIILNDSASPKMVTQIYLHFFYRFLEVFECLRGDPYMTAENNFGR